ncbi:macrolide ABC transporter ATP-binding protein [bacterium (Candidatus Blackallbacteria) CG17_big_fil_post_rev_8_21_14_2_50_48_46]|uniref:Macrolide ABC transporter ATP-binding protein n=1 Tax=bacterium (Candidatus Blackallbacteria) CG17_big_fil_post_rev_8_21_14_2_50_48_46 TaxID=2014261 RepID=A0A2M7FZJ7_9BACT|nr:MAG: macrolide ABC transporter ATP-binding protein [bacterium (Candidatus Blackallbacteria) CG18_big_fil_WC_8_21_14_2_50_49_26]PIW14715.1 MAG: macrolide ABC transporter ATP-binding protein [bacterium (Candidatus Blackallbacteria) CG17_big_fil_post_rev_8_21_14_2_50_48_46]PIW50817.1 MAG: macrolide ABC transporter ATP-binding protein [bacterium (Candidatus Blackallbacteria) CG13_big_fil_rev_8_21_14_2_50_49_14]
MLEARELVKTYRMAQQEVQALRGVSFTVEAGEMVAIMGPSGSGKSTLMTLLGCLDTPTSGSLSLDDVDVSQASEVELSHIRNQKIGFVFQSFNLLTDMTALENVALPLFYARLPKHERMARAQAALEHVGLGERIHHTPLELSGGQQQRVSVARALVGKPALLLADEPTGALDTRTSYEIMHLLQNLNQEGSTLVIITHEMDIARCCRRIVILRDGKIESDTPNTPWRPELPEEEAHA